MKRIVLLVMLAAAVVVATMTLAGIASAQSCFSTLARSGQPPGELVSKAATELAEPGEPGSNTDDAARQVGLAKQAIPCPPSS
jgi:hypothetical protein